MNQESSNFGHHQEDRRRHHRPWRSTNVRGTGRGRGRRPQRPTEVTSPTHAIQLNEGRSFATTEYGDTNQTNSNNVSDENPVPDQSCRQICNEGPYLHNFMNQCGLIEPGMVSDQNRSKVRNLNRRGRGSRQRLVGETEDFDSHFSRPGREHEGPRGQETQPRAQRRPRGRSSNLSYRSEINPDRNNSGESKFQNQVNSHNQLNYNKFSLAKGSSKDTSNIQSEIAELQFRSNDFECMICCDNIHRSNPIWYCDSCYNIFHLKCAVEWCNKSIKSRNDAISNAEYPSLAQIDLSQNNRAISSELARSPEGYSEYRAERINSVEWPCPTCREVRYSRPNKYKCFCGKVVRPEINRHLTPHSCGQLCGRKRPHFDCPHTCNSICHPGRCNACLLTSRRSCFCGKLTREVKCSVATSSCNEICGKPLSCGLHFCTKICHDKPCGSCEEILTISCHCGLREVRKRCVDLSKADKKTKKKFSCDKICGKLLDCGKHFCDEKCHPGPDCSSCKFLSQNIRTCPCGSTVINKSSLLDRNSCMDPIPTCENRCNLPLICGPDKNRHKCQKKCHTGLCPPCKLKMTAHCECKLSTKTIECSQMYAKVINEDRIYFEQIKYSFTCETRCNKLKNCGRHRCNNKCCNFIKNSEPSIHRCDQICNKKLPCGQHNCPEICHLGQCGDCTNIGWEELTCHCGSSVLYPPIPCGAHPPACHRPCRRSHNCGHPVKHECHDDTEKCAPCIFFVKKSCFCDSDSKDSVYCYLPGYSCGRICKKLLSCKQHACKRVCHDNECETPNERGVIHCTQPCPIARYSCKHPCGIPCHGTTVCPSSECRKIIEVSCECGNKVERSECYRVMKDVDNRNKMAMLSTNRANQDTIIVDLSKKSSPKPGNENDSCFKMLACDETCSILKRNKALAEALDIVQPDLKPASIFGEDPLRLLKEATAQDYKFVAATFNSLARFIKSAKESEKRFIFMQFPPAGKLRREVVHELAHHFNCTSESREEEPFKHVVVRAYKNKSCVPDFSIEQLLPVSD